MSLPEGTPGNRKVSRVDDLLIDELVGVVVLCICGERGLVPTLIFKVDFNLIDLVKFGKYHQYTVTSRPTRVYGEKSHHMARFLTI